MSKLSPDLRKNKNGLKPFVFVIFWARLWCGSHWDSFLTQTICVIFFINIWDCAKLFSAFHQNNSHSDISEDLILKLWQEGGGRHAFPSINTRPFVFYVKTESKRLQDVCHVLTVVFLQRTPKTLSCSCWMMDILFVNVWDNCTTKEIRKVTERQIETGVSCLAVLPLPA